MPLGNQVVAAFVGKDMRFKDFVTILNIAPSLAHRQQNDPVYASCFSVLFIFSYVKKPEPVHKNI